MKCHEASCSAKEVCTLVDGERTCAATSQATCSASGDPHYKTFDGRKFDFQGTCVYQLVGLCSRQEGLEPFNVTVQNDHRGSTSVSFTKTVKLYIYGITLTLSRQYPNRILVSMRVDSIVRKWLHFKKWQYVDLFLLVFWKRRKWATAFRVLKIKQQIQASQA